MGSRNPSRAREHVMDLGDFSAEWKPEIITRNEGVTPEEQYLQRLCDSSFLSLWSYAGPSRDQKARGKGDGKELCDLLVVSGDDVLIFSDKAYKFPDTGNIKLDWSRWFKRAIQKSAEQAWGAGRWLKEHPGRIFLDPGCTQKFPIDLPAPERTITPTNCPRGMLSETLSTARELPNCFVTLTKSSDKGGSDGLWRRTIGQNGVGCCLRFYDKPARASSGAAFSN